MIFNKEKYIVMTEDSYTKSIEDILKCLKRIYFTGNYFGNQSATTRIYHK